MENPTPANRRVDNVKPEWVRVPEAVRLFGLSRSAVYDLITAGTIKSTALKKRGAIRGIRLVSFDSLAAFIEASCNAEIGSN